MELPTSDEVGKALANLGNWRVLHVQEVLYPYTKVPASIMLGIGYRETGLRNICGGAVWDSATKKWVASKTDRGWLQISDQMVEDADWLRRVPGCIEGAWAPAQPAVPAITTGHVPRFSDALAYTYKTMIEDMEFGVAHGVPEDEILRFAVAAHNAGATGALHGWGEGNVDKNTAHGDYSAYVLAIQATIHEWIIRHPHWQYRPPTAPHLNV